MKRDRIYMLDTNILIFMLRGLKASDPSPQRVSAQRVRDQIVTHMNAGATVCVSAITICELEYGAGKSQHPERERKAVYKVLAPFVLLEFDPVSLPRHYGEIRNQLEKAGNSIGAMDLMIAAHALSIGATLITNNTSEFERVPHLAVQDWSVG